ncbi:hypothetical protein D9M68_902840 [compost metagenome]
MFAKTRVFDRQHGVLQPLGRAGKRHVFAPFGTELRQFDAVGGEHLQRQFGLVIDDPVDRRQIESGRLNR